MSQNRRPAPEELQPKFFEFNDENLLKSKNIISRYPKGREASAIMPLFDLAQRQHSGWLPLVAINYVADMVGVNHIQAYEVATFYTMYNLVPVGQHVVQICTTTPCKLRGADKMIEICTKKIGIKPGETSKNNLFTLFEVECLGACVNAPVAWIGDDYYEDLNEDSMNKILDDLNNGEINSKPGSQIGRSGSEPLGERKTLIMKGRD